MYIYLIWKSRQSKDKVEFDNALNNILIDKNWVMPLEDFYLIKVNNRADREQLYDRLAAIAQAFSARVDFFMSQPLEGGGYSGWLLQEDWDEVHERTK